MSDAKTFGRRSTGSLPKGFPPSAPVRDLPSLQDLGFTPFDDAEALRTFKQDYRKRRFIRRGGWRWVGGVCVLASTITGLAGLSDVSSLLGAAGVLAFGYTLLRRFLPGRTP